MNVVEVATATRARLADLPPPEAPVFPFPWDGLEKFAANQPGGQLPVVGYGSLLNKASAARTLNESAQRTPCIAYGCRRVFNYRMPVEVLKRFGVTQISRSIAALNALATYDLTDLINGILFGVAQAEIAAFRLREFGYDLKPVYCLPWKDPKDSPFLTAYILCAPDIASKPEYQVTDGTLLPQPGYAKLCEEGASEVSKEFLDLFLATTYLADKITLWKP